LAKTVQGKTYQWRLGDAPIGSGDAGEVYAVACVDQPELTGVLKKPARIATGGTIQRQAGQIAQEALALAQLEGLPTCKAHPPSLLDEAPDFTQGTANYFIVSETAPGEDMAAMLTRTRQEGVPFPRRVILTVLDALFDLFARAHRAGVLWNDVKLEHIYWQPDTGGVSVIDWGNAQFLENPNGQRRPLPRWEDYRQMVDTLGAFLQQSAPELYADLGWSEFQGEDLDLPRVSVLARRIDYQHEVIALRVMEYQSLIRVVLKGDPTLAGLQKIQSYQKILLQIGAPWEAPAVLDYGKQLVTQALTDGDTQTAVRATTIIWDLFGETLNLAWHLLREYFRYSDILTHPALADLVRTTLNERWDQVIWHLAQIASEGEAPAWWDQLIPVIRQKSLGAALPLPRQITQTLLEWTQSGPSADPVSIAALSDIYNQWRTRGQDLQESPFDYALLEIARNQPDLPRRLRTELKSGFAAGEDAIRALLQAWVNTDWETLPKACRQVLAWDPDRWGVLTLAEALNDFRTWLDELYEGPVDQRESSHFITDLLERRPQLEKLLGSPPWLQALLKLLNDIQGGYALASYQAGLQTWCPWLVGYETIHTTEVKTVTPNAESVQKVLAHFSQHLKNWSDLDTGLDKVRHTAPADYLRCRQLANGFQTIFHLNAELEEIQADCTAIDHPALAEACAVLQTLLAWREALHEQDFEQALAACDPEAHPGWRVLEHAHAITQHWIDSVQPCLDAIETADIAPCDSTQPELGTVLSSLSALTAQWERIYTALPHQDLLESLESETESLQKVFHTWRHGLDHNPDPGTRLLYHNALAQIRAISDKLLQLAQHTRQARLSFSNLESADALPYARQIQAGDSLLDHLGAVEALLVQDESARKFPAWHKLFQQITSLHAISDQREAILEMDKGHPLYAWLIQSTLARDT
jgi:serine/threonine protein kinase